MRYQEKFYPESRFGGFTDIDGTVAFFSRVNSLVLPSSIVLDVGCGRGAFADDPVAFRKNLRTLRGKVAQVIRIDVDISAQTNPFLDEFGLIEDGIWPVDDGSIDLILCDSVLEHIDKPEVLFAEAQRVLNNGGYLCLRTTNQWSYVAILARLIPNRHHARVTALVQNDRKKEDVFPTAYKCNTIGRIKSLMKKNHFECVVYGYEAEPAYLSLSKVLYALGVVHQKLAPGFLKPVVFAFGKVHKLARTKARRPHGVLRRCRRRSTRKSAAWTNNYRRRSFRVIAS